MFTKHIEPEDDRIHSQKDDEWNQKILEFFAKGRLEDISQLSRDIHSQIRVREGCRVQTSMVVGLIDGTT